MKPILIRCELDNDVIAKWIVFSRNFAYGAGGREGGRKGKLSDWKVRSNGILTCAYIARCAKHPVTERRAPIKCKLIRKAIARRHPDLNCTEGAAS